MNGAGAAAAIVDVASRSCCNSNGEERCSEEDSTSSSIAAAPISRSGCGSSPSNTEWEEGIVLLTIPLYRSGGDALPVCFLQSLSGDQVLSLWGIQEVHCSFSSSLPHHHQHHPRRRHHAAKVQVATVTITALHPSSSSSSSQTANKLQENDVIIRVLGDPITSLAHISQLFRFCDTLSVDVLRKQWKTTSPKPTIQLPNDTIETGKLLVEVKHRQTSPPSPQPEQGKDEQEHPCSESALPTTNINNNNNNNNNNNKHQEEVSKERIFIERIHNHILFNYNSLSPTHIDTIPPILNTSKPQEHPPTTEVQQQQNPQEEHNTTIRHNTTIIHHQQQQEQQKPQQQQQQQQEDEPRFLWFNCTRDDSNDNANNDNNINNDCRKYQNHSTASNISTANKTSTGANISTASTNRTRTDSTTSLTSTTSRFHNNPTVTLPSSIGATTIPTTTATTKDPPNSGGVSSMTTFLTAIPAAKTKLKRLWPNSSIFQKRIMKWIPPEPVLGKNGIVRFRGPIQTTSSSVAGESLRQDTSSSSTNQTIISKISDSFRDASHIVQEICPHLLEEARVNINDEFYNKSDKDAFWMSPTYVVRLHTLTAVDATSVAHAANSPRTFEFGFQPITSTNYSSTKSENSNSSSINTIPSNLGDVFAIFCEEWTNTKCCIGIVGSHDINSTFLQDQKIVEEEEKNEKLFTLWLCCVSKDNEQTGWLANADMPTVHPDGSVQRQIMHILYLGSVITTLREFDGLKGLSSIKHHLQRAIFCVGLKHPPLKPMTQAQIATTGSYSNIGGIAALGSTPSRPSSLSQDCWNKICAKLNPYQAGAIETFMSGKAKENVFLLQGPPGTGKTEVVLSLISVLLNAPCPQPGAWKASGIAIHVGSSLSKTNSSANSPSKGSRGKVKTRILVCAPSNIAVDDLACRIHDSCIGPSGRIGGFKLVRFGLLPGEERTDGGRKRTYQSPGSNIYKSTSGWDNNPALMKREEFLFSINLDLIATSSIAKRNILTNAHVVCTTLNSSGSKSFIDASLRDDSSSEYDVVIIDEACQASEPSSLIPFKFNPKAVILVGDVQQLPVTIRSQSAEKANLGRSLFQRLRTCGWPVEMLRIQYRMRPEIVQFPSNQFYDGQLITPNKSFPFMPWHICPCLPPLLLWNVHNASMTRSVTGGICNHAEKQFIIHNILTALAKVMVPYDNEKNIVQIGIISFYSDQVSLIKSSLAEIKWSHKNLRIQVSTVDGFQGSEKDIIILSCVRSRGGNRNSVGGVGFLSDYRRVNVAMTRAKHSFWVVGDCDTLVVDPVWKNFVEDAARRSLIRDAVAFWNIFSSHGGTSRQCNNYYTKGKSMNRRNTHANNRKRKMG